MGSFRDSAIAARRTLSSTSIESTKNRFVRYMSRKEAQKGLSDHAIPMLPVTRAISVSECPRFLSIVPATQMAMAKGIPIAK